MFGTRSMLVRAGHVVLLRSLSSVPLTLLATSRYRTPSLSLVQLVSLRRCGGSNTQGRDACGERKWGGAAWETRIVEEII